MAALSDPAAAKRNDYQTIRYDLGLAGPAPIGSTPTPATPRPSCKWRPWQTSQITQRLADRKTQSSLCQLDMDYRAVCADLVLADVLVKNGAVKGRSGPTCIGKIKSPPLPVAYIPVHRKYPTLGPESFTAGSMRRFSTVLRIVLAGLAILPNLASCDTTPHGEEEKKKMGPVAFMWPPDREWNDDLDNTPPCGSRAPANNRTNFPLLNGAVALTIADDAWNVTLRISYVDEPTAERDFTTLLTSVSDIDLGHQCYTLPSLPSNIEEGANATIQLEYQAVDDSKNKSQYACADITFVPVHMMQVQVPCFNVTSDEFVEDDKSEKASSANALRIGVTITGLAVAVALLLV
ncbi:MAG: hypothetical protein M1840_003802 [Geoglossum simile]|nr:MAG: hypothetical protein M1840_003802 [Geoglossum simile]